MSKSVCVVRLTTSAWHDNRGAHLKKSLTVLKRQSEGYNILLGHCDDVGAEEIMLDISNLNSVRDGVYKVELVNPWTDPETGCDDWDGYKLVPVDDAD